MRVELMLRFLEWLHPREPWYVKVVAGALVVIWLLWAWEVLS